MQKKDIFLKKIRKIQKFLKNILLLCKYITIIYIIGFFA